MIERAKGGVVMPVRIGSGIGWIVAGIILFSLGVFLGIVAGAATEPISLSLALLAISAGSLCLVIGFWTRLFHALEQRLVEVQAAILGDRAREPEASDKVRADNDWYIG